MADRFVIMPAGYVLGAGDHGTFEQAAAQAARLVDADRTPRVVLRVAAEIKPSAVPRVDVTRFDTVEVPNG